MSCDVLSFNVILRVTTFIAQFVVERWCMRRLRKRYCWGSMLLDECYADSFIGVTTRWSYGLLEAFPCFMDPFGASAYNSLDHCPIKSWCSWAPTAQKVATIRGILARCWYLSSSSCVRVHAYWQAFNALVHVAEYPYVFVRGCARSWASSWVPRRKSESRSEYVVVQEVEQALRYCVSVRE